MKKIDSKDSVITCYVAPGKWIIKISEKGVIFNHEDYPDCLPGDFAQAFANLLEREFEVTMQRRWFTLSDVQPPKNENGDISKMLVIDKFGFISVGRYSYLRDGNIEWIGCLEPVYWTYLPLEPT